MQKIQEVLPRAVSRLSFYLRCRYGGVATIFITTLVSYR